MDETAILYIQQIGWVGEEISESEILISAYGAGVDCNRGRHIDQLQIDIFPKLLPMKYPFLLSPFTP